MSTHRRNQDRSKSDTRPKSRNRPIAALICRRISPFLACIFTGCAVHTYDAATGTEHLWGFGHLKMSVAAAQDSSKTQAILTGVRTAGIRLGLGSVRQLVLNAKGALRLTTQIGQGTEFTVFLPLARN